ncbi:MAG: Ig-like domain-containing protein [Chloroflexi bacterium]|nr:Ig-like domain-containing protein [Chloroflexota bacterium]
MSSILSFLRPSRRSAVWPLTALLLLALLTLGTTSAAQTAVARPNPLGQSLRTPEAVAITATKTDTLLVDVDGDTNPDPGDTLRYSIIVANSGSTDALSTLFTDITDDTEVTVVGGSLRATPIGTNDTYTVIGNTHITHPAGTGVLANDVDPDGGSITASCAPCTTANGGTVTLNADGSFTYNPPAGFTGTDSFTYTVTDNHLLTDTGTVTFNVANRIWWVDSDAAGAGTGTSADPFQALASAQTASLANDTIFVYSRGANYTAGFVLKSGQKLCGHGANLATCSGLTAPTGTTFPSTSTNPTIVNAAGHVITLDQNNTIQGVTLGNSGGAANFALFGSSFGNLTIQTVTINTNNGGLSLATGSATATFTSITSSGGTNNISLTSVNGNLNLGSGALTGASGNAVNIVGGTAAVSTTATITNTSAKAVNIQSKTGGTVTFGGSINSVSGGTGITLLNNTGATITFAGSMTLNTGTNTAFSATGGGTVSALTGIHTITTSTGTGINIRNMTIGVVGFTVRSVTTNGAANGIYLENNSGSGNFTVVGTGVAGSGGNIQNSTSDGIYLSGVSNVSLNNLNITTTGQHGIFGTLVNNLTLNNMVLSNTGNADNEDALFFATAGVANVTGNLVLNNVDISNFLERGLNLLNNSGSLTISINTGSSFSDNHDTFGSTAVSVESTGTASIQLNVDNTTFDNVEGPSVDFRGGSSGTNDANYTNLTSTNGGGPDNFPSGGGLEVKSQNGASVTFDITGNLLSNTIEGIIIATAGTTGGDLNGTISNNTISMDSVAGLGDGVRLSLDGFTGGAGENRTWTIAVLNNSFDLNSVGDDGMQVLNRDHSGNLYLTVEGNTFRETLSEAFRYFSDEDLGAFSPRGQVRFVNNDLISIDVDANESEFVGITQDEANTCYHISGNDNGAGGSFGAINFTITAPAVGQITQASTAALSAANGGSTIAGATPTFGGSCTTPPLPSLAPVVMPSAELPTQQVAIEEVSASAAEATHNAPAEVVDTAETAPVPAIVVATETTEAKTTPFAPEATTTVGPFTLPAGEQTTITFAVVIQNPFPAAQNPICNQATISGGNFSNVLSDDPDVGGAADPTCTTVITTIIWDGGGADNNWNTAANWNPDRIPTATDLVIFNGTSSKNAFVNVPFTIYALQVNTGYNGTIAQATNVFSILTDYTHASGTMVVSPIAPLTVGTAMNHTGGTLRQTLTVNAANVPFLTITDGGPNIRYRGIEVDTSGNGNNLGNVTVNVRRVDGTSSFCTLHGGGSPAYALRCFNFYALSPAPAVMRFWVHTSELNGLTPASLQPYRNDAGGPVWNLLSPSTTGNDGGAFVYTQATVAEGFGSILVGGAAAPTAVTLQHTATTPAFPSLILATLLLLILTGWAGWRVARRP